MSSSAASPCEARRNVGDSLAIGIFLMLMVNVVQRCVGLIRGLGFAHFLSDVELGQWALASSFFIIAVPLSVLGLPGSFGKFVEYYRARERFAEYFRRVTMVSACGLGVACAVILVMPEAFGWMILGETTSFGIILWCVVALVCAVTFSFVSELAAAFRQVQSVSHMQFVQSFAFAIVGLVLVSIYRSWWVLLPSFAIAHCIALVPGCWKLRHSHSAEFLPRTSGEPAPGIWRRIAPYAAALWLVNLLSNMFELSDRYMLLHLVSSNELIGQAAVGQYHCARILPNLLTSLSLMLGGVLLPYLSADWEAGRREMIAARIRRIVQSVCIGFLALSIAAMVTAPLLFQFVFEGRYALAQSVLPLALLQATWVGLFLVAEPYLLCAEKGRQLAAVLLVGLAVNLGFNWFFIQWFGLHGTIAATATANFLALMLLFWQLGRSGCGMGMGTTLLVVAPLSLVAGPSAATVALVVIVLIAGRTDWILDSEDRQHIDLAVLPKLNRLGIRLETLWP